jgi:hypothetical protein
LSSKIESLKSKATIGMLWVAVEKFSVQAGQLVIGIVLARLLVPDDFGLIGLLSIFIIVFQSFVDSGMGSYPGNALVHILHQALAPCQWLCLELQFGK